MVLSKENKDHSCVNWKQAWLLEWVMSYIIKRRKWQKFKTIYLDTAQGIKTYKKFILVGIRMPARSKRSLETFFAVAMTSSCQLWFYTNVNFTLFHKITSSFPVTEKHTSFKIKIFLSTMIQQPLHITEAIFSLLMQ